jgi:hypothetical protein
MKKQGIALTFNCFSDMKGGFEYGSREYDPDEIGDLLKILGRAAAILDSSEWGRERKKAIISTKYTIWKLDPTLSYRPTKPELAGDEIKFFEWFNFHLSLDKEEEFVTRLAETKRLCEEKGVGRPYSVFRNVAGEAGPLYTIVIPARDPGDSHDFKERVKKLLGGEYELFPSALLSTVATVDADGGWAIPELSMQSN